MIFSFSRTYSLTGAYRKLLVKPRELSWEFMKYKNDTDALIQSDWEEIRKFTKPTSVEDGALKALILDFCLPSSTYATMALREILKADTSAAHQTQLQLEQTAKRDMEATPAASAEESSAAKKPKLDTLPVENEIKAD